MKRFALLVFAVIITKLVGLYADKVLMYTKLPMGRVK
jgi:hypothetical protein